MRKGSKCKKALVHVFRIKIVLTFIVLFFSFHQVAPVYVRELKCLAVLLKPAECQKIVSHIPGSLKRTFSFNTTQCYESLANWTLNLKLKQKDPYLVLKKRLHKIGRADLVPLIHNCFTRFLRELTVETIDDWGLKGAKKETTRKLRSVSNSTLSKIDNLLFGSTRLEPIRSSSKHAKNSKSRLSVGSRLKPLMKISPRIKSDTFNRESEDKAESSPFLRDDDGKKNLQNVTKQEKEEGWKRAMTGYKFYNPIGHWSKSAYDLWNKTSTSYSCLRMNPYVVLSIVIFISICACILTLLIRRKIVACINCLRCKKKKKKSSSKYIPIDSESQEISRRKKKSFSFKPGKRKSHESSKALVNTATQDSQASILKIEEEPTGCCKCCKKKTKKDKKRRK